MDFSLTTLFVATSGTLASSGSTDALTPGQIGVFDNAYVIGSAGTIATKPYIYVAQGRKENISGVGSKRSDKIAASKVVAWYKVVAEPDSTQEVWEATSFDVACDDTLSIGLRLHSSYIDVDYFNGLTRSVVVQAPCCDCGENPCTSITEVELGTMIDEAATKINADPLLSAYVTASRTGTTLANITLRIVSKPLTTYTNPFVLGAFPPQADRIWGRLFVVKGPATTQDFIINDACDFPAVSTIKQRSSFTRGSSAEIKALEEKFYSYQTPAFKQLHTSKGWNGAFETYVTDGTYYDIYYIKALEHDKDITYNDYVTQNFTVAVAFPTGTGTAFETLLTAYLGAPLNKSGADVTTTTSTSSTSSTSTTSTSTLIP